jgi:hypothetical protein
MPNKADWIKIDSIGRATCERCKEQLTWANEVIRNAFIEHHNKCAAPDPAITSWTFIDDGELHCERCQTLEELGERLSTDELMAQVALFSAEHANCQPKSDEQREIERLKSLVDVGEVVARGFTGQIEELKEKLAQVTALHQMSEKPVVGKRVTVWFKGSPAAIAYYDNVGEWVAVWADGKYEQQKLFGIVNGMRWSYIPEAGEAQ